MDRRVIILATVLLSLIPHSHCQLEDVNKTEAEENEEDEEEESKNYLNMFSALNISNEMKSIVNHLWGTPEMKVSFCQLDLHIWKPNFKKQKESIYLWRDNDSIYTRVSAL